MYALNIGSDGRVLSVTYSQYAPADAPIVETLPEGDVSNYRYVDEEFIYDPLPESEATPTAQDDIDAMLVDHEFRLMMLELGLTE